MNIGEDLENVIPFDEIVIELFENREDKNHVDAMYKYIHKNKYNFCLIHLITLDAICVGYLERIKYKNANTF